MGTDEGREFSATSGRLVKEYASLSSVFPIRHDRYDIPGASPEPGRIVAPYSVTSR
jgi:hypothetical protein